MAVKKNDPHRAGFSWWEAWGPAIGVGDGGRGVPTIPHFQPPPLKKEKNPGKKIKGNHAKFGHFVNFYQRVSIASYANRWYSQRRNVRLSVRPSVRLSVTLRYCIKTKKASVASWFLHHPRARTF